MTGKAWQQEREVTSDTESSVRKLRGMDGGVPLASYFFNWDSSQWSGAVHFHGRSSFFSWLSLSENAFIDSARDVSL